MAPRFVLPAIPADQRTPLVEALLGIIEMQAERIQRQDEQIELLKEEIRILKGLSKRPRFKPSGMDEKTDPDQGASGENKPDTKRPGSDKRSKTAQLVIHEDQLICPSMPGNSRYCGMGCAGSIPSG